MAAAINAVEEFCGSQFWDWELTWTNGTNPDFTPCFEKTVLVWIPTGFLCLFGCLDVYYSINSDSRNIPLNAFNSTKIFMGLLLSFIQMIKFYLVVAPPNESYVVHHVDLFTPPIQFITFLLATALILLAKRKGIRSSGVQFSFWLLQAICDTIRFRTVIQNIQDVRISHEPLPYMLEVFHYPLVLAELLLQCFTDAKPLYSRDEQPTQNVCPENDASFLSRITFSWNNGMAWTGFKRAITYDDLWALKHSETSDTVVPNFYKHWNNEIRKAKEKRKASGKSEETRPSLLPVILRLIGTMYFTGIVMKFVPDTLSFVAPMILQSIIAFTDSPEEPIWKGIFLTCCLSAATLIQSIVMAQCVHRMYVVGMHVRTSLTSAIYKKALLLSNAAKKETTIGKIVNLMSVDTQKLMDFFVYSNFLWSTPYQVGFALYLLWGQLGPSSLAGLAVMILIIPFNGFIASQVRKLHGKQMTLKDKRVKLMNEILSGIKVLKLYAWEASFQDQISVLREKEVEVLKKAAYLNAMTSFFTACAPFLVSLASFATYVLVDENNVLDAQKAFVSLALFNIMNFPMSFVPMVLVFFIQAFVSVKRLNQFMRLPELDRKSVTHDSDEGDQLIIENGSFSWVPGTTVLSNINFRVKPGELVAVVGTVGSGKSSLLTALLGEMEKESGRVNTKGTVAYVAQQAWIQNVTLRENITFGKSHDSSKYKKIIDCCALTPDLSILPAGDKTEIGEKGINLSGGQKQRVSLARAVYSDSDIYLLDDPLSAVDSHVGKHIFDEVIGPSGILKKKTRVLVTHGISYLPHMDNIFVMKDGRISECGTYKELLEKKGEFADFLNEYANKDSSEDKEESGECTEDEARLLRARLSSLSSEEGEGETWDSRKLSFVKRSSISDRKMSNLSAASKAPFELIEEEKLETAGVQLQVYLSYFKAAGIGYTIGTVFSYLLFQAFAVGSNFWLSSWTDSASSTNHTSEDTETYLLGFGGFGIAQAIFVCIATGITSIAAIRSSALLHNKMLYRILKAPMSFFETTPTGRIVNRFSKDVDVCDSILPLFVRLWFSFLFQVGAIIFIVSYVTPLFTIVIIPTAVLYYALQKFYIATSRQLKRLESVTRSPIYSHFSETVVGAPTIRAYGHQKRFILESEQKVDHNQRCYFPAIVANRWLAIRLEIIGNTVVFFSALFAVLGRDTLSPGLVGLSVTYALQTTFALNLLVRWSSEVETNIVAVERIQEYGSVKQEASWETIGKKPSEEWPERGEVKFENYETRYRPGLDLVLNDITFTINPGEKIGVVGRTGAGKSSLTLALFRIIESSGGKITVDGENISRLGLHDIRGRITIIPQDPVLFSGSMRINLDPFEQYSDEKIWKCLELAHLKKFVMELPETLNYEISEGGENLSVGQRQMVCLARALLRKSKILVLDEATAAVDLETDDLIQETIRNEFKESTVITIAHRLNTIMDSNRVLVLEKGAIKEFEQPSALLKDPNSTFYSMAKDAKLLPS